MKLSAKPNLITWVAFFTQNQICCLMIKINSKIDICWYLASTIYSILRKSTFTVYTVWEDMFTWTWTFLHELEPDQVLADIFTWNITRCGQTFLHELKSDQVLANIFTWTETWPGIGRHFYMKSKLTRYWQKFFTWTEIFFFFLLNHKQPDITSWEG